MEFMVLGHRGAMAYAPENTMKSFELALNLGVNGLETDVRQTKDGVLVLFHDEDLHRYGGDVKVADLDFRELLQWDLGEGERIVDLESFLARFGAIDLFLDIELKQRYINKEVLEQIGRYVKNKEKVSITAFDFATLKDVRELDEGIRISWLTHDLTDSELEHLTYIKATSINPKAENITKEKVQNAKARGYNVRAWGVANEQDMLHCLDCGVDGMTVNFPDKLLQELRKRRVK